MNSKAIFSYAREKLVTARRILMLPHPKGEAQSLAAAFHECYLGLDKLPDSAFHGSATEYIRTIRSTIDTTGVIDDHGRGTFTVKAEQLTESEKHDFSAAVDDLLYWMDDA